MVVMALITTIMTTPVVTWLYPEWYQKQTADRFNDDEDVSSTEVGKYDPSIARDPSIVKLSKIELGGHFNLVTMLNRIETVPSVMTLIRLLKQDKADTSEIQLIKNKLSIHVLRLLELTQRSSDVMKIQDIHETKRHDPVLAVLRTFTRLIGIESAHTHLEFSYPSDYMKTVQDYSESVLADMILLPWVSTSHHRQEPSSNAEVNPFDQVTSSKLNTYQISDAEFASAAYSIKDFSVGLFIDRGFGHSHEEDLPFQIVVPFMGGVDDRAALLFALRLSRQSDLLVLTMMGKEKETTYATPLSVAKTLNISEDDNTTLLNSLFVSETESNIALQCVVPSSSNSSFSVLSGLKRPLGKNDLIVVGRSLHGPVMFTPNPTETPGQQPISREFKAALGNSAYEILSSGTVASLVVVQGPIESGASFEA
jgi:hypothetical protein